MPVYSRVAAVTGANKGLGFAIARNIALQYRQSPLNNGPLLIYLTARNEGRGEAALSALYSDATLKSERALRPDGGLTDLQYRQLDVSEGSSIAAFETFIAETHPEGIDILVNNAGVASSGVTSVSAGSGLDREIDVAAQVVEVNYYGTLRMTRALLPHMKAGGRIVNMASMLGKLKGKYSAEVAAAFQEAAKGPKTGPSQPGGAEAAVTALMQRYIAAIQDGRTAEEGWPSSSSPYAVSKTGVIGMTMALAREQQSPESNASGNAPPQRKQHRSQGVLINSCCPGYVTTDLTHNRGRKTPDQGAATPVHLALADLGGVSGEFWERQEVSSW